MPKRRFNSRKYNTWLIIENSRKKSEKEEAIFNK
jgi:hypothetical protein